MEGQSIDYSPSENVNDTSNLLDHFWPTVKFESVANNSYIERFAPLEAYNDTTQVQITEIENFLLKIYLIHRFGIFGSNLNLQIHLPFSMK